MVNENLDRHFEIFTEVPESSMAVPPKKALPYFLWTYYQGDFSLEDLSNIKWIKGY